MMIGLQHYEIAQTHRGLGVYFGEKLVQNTKREIFFKIEYFKRWAHLLRPFEMLKFIVNCYLLKVAVL